MLCYSWQRSVTSVTEWVTMPASARWMWTVATSATSWGTLPRSATRRSILVSKWMPAGIVSNCKDFFWMHAVEWGINWKHHIKQRKSSRKHTEEFPFYGLWYAVFTAFGCNLRGDAFHRFLCNTRCCLSAAGHARQLFWHMFLEIKLQRRTMYTTLKI